MPHAFDATAHLRNLAASQPNALIQVRLYVEPHPSAQAIQARYQESQLEPETRIAPSADERILTTQELRNLLTTRLQFVYSFLKEHDLDIETNSNNPPQPDENCPLSFSTKLSVRGSTLNRILALESQIGLATLSHIPHLESTDIQQFSEYFDVGETESEDGLLGRLIRAGRPAIQTLARLRGAGGSRKGANVSIAVVDLGFAGNKKIRNFGTIQDFTGNGGLSNNHGTCVASRIADSKLGIAPDASILPIVVDYNIDNACKGICYALDQNVDLICMAISWDRWKSAAQPERWRKICETILARGKLHACSIGNNGGLTGKQAQPPDQIASPGDCPPPLPQLGAPSSAISCGSFSSGMKLSKVASMGPSAWPGINKSLYISFKDFPYPRSPLCKPDLMADGGPAHPCSGSFMHNFFIKEASLATATIAGHLAVVLGEWKALFPGCHLDPSHVLEAMLGGSSIAECVPTFLPKKSAPEQAIKHAKKQSWWARC
ncbi:MAG: S8 family serine peptidase [Acidobacteria bacterium]|nr:S8 family serine peptidase [Acidobacteriota bacterium]